MYLSPVEIGPCVSSATECTRIALPTLAVAPKCPECPYFRVGVVILAVVQFIYLALRQDWFPDSE